jgi:hypothetical protein
VWEVQALAPEPSGAGLLRNSGDHRGGWVVA